jgi:uncharacterized protein (TIGR01777 family)
VKVLITGGSGLVGRALIPRLLKEGHEVAGLVRPGGKPLEKLSSIDWRPQTGEIDQTALVKFGGAGAVVHLAGENIAGGRWTEKRKKKIPDSRVVSTRLLCESLAKISRPEVFVAASAIGFYGNRGEEILTERSSPGNEFLSEVTVGWEEACEALRKAGSRVVNLRFGVILSTKGGALAKMLPVFKTGLGGRVGNGKQWMSWVSIEDVVNIIMAALEKADFTGPINVVSPNPVRNEEFTKRVGKVLGRWTVLPVPAFALRLLFGELADALLLTSQRVAPERLQALGYKFQFPDLENALRNTIIAS